MRANSISVLIQPLADGKNYRFSREDQYSGILCASQCESSSDQAGRRGLAKSEGIAGECDECPRTMKRLGRFSGNDPTGKRPSSP